MLIIINIKKFLKGIGFMFKRNEKMDKFILRLKQNSALLDKLDFEQLNALHKYLIALRKYAKDEKGE